MDYYQLTALGIPLPDQVCINCSGVHRSLGVHVSKVRSATLDEWNQDLVDLVVLLGNGNSNHIWEAGLPDGVKPVSSAQVGV